MNLMIPFDDSEIFPFRLMPFVCFQSNVFSLVDIPALTAEISWLLFVGHICNLIMPTLRMHFVMDEDRPTFSNPNCLLTQRKYVMHYRRLP